MCGVYARTVPVDGSLFLCLPCRRLQQVLTQLHTTYNTHHIKTMGFACFIYKREIGPGLANKVGEAFLEAGLFLTCRLGGTTCPCLGPCPSALVGIAWHWACLHHTVISERERTRQPSPHTPHRSLAHRSQTIIHPRPTDVPFKSLSVLQVYQYGVCVWFTESRWSCADSNGHSSTGLGGVDSPLAPPTRRQRGRRHERHRARPIIHIHRHTRVRHVSKCNVDFSDTGSLGGGVSEGWDWARTGRGGGGRGRVRSWAPNAVSSATAPPVAARRPHSRRSTHDETGGPVPYGLSRCQTPGVLSGRDAPCRSAPWLGV